MVPPSPPLSPPPARSPFLTLQRWDRPLSPAHYRPAPAYTFHAYSPPPEEHHPDPISPPALSMRRASRLSAPFPTFLYADTPPPRTARNKQRMRPTAEQLAHLKSLYAQTQHPTRDEREALGRTIGMRYQSVTNWFQNQRSTAKKRPAATTPPRGTETPSRTETPRRPATPEPEPAPAPASTPAPTPAPADPPPPPRARHRTDPVRDIINASRRPGPPLALPLSGCAIAPLAFRLPPAPLTTPSPPAGREAAFQLARAPSPAASARDRDRGRRSRPTPHQLAALRALHAVTPSPSIEARTRVGREIGMELGKVTNWFRNLRQTARKKARRAHGRAHEHEHEHEMRSELGTESDAAHEAVTPEPAHRGASPRAPVKHASVDDAMLLLAFHGAHV